jgi:hypothetical protein
MATSGPTRRAARERVAAYHEACLAELLDRLISALDSYRAGTIDVEHADQSIHRYHRATRELWKFCFASGVDVEMIARLIDEPAPPIDWWERGATRSRH